MKKAAILTLLGLAGCTPGINFPSITNYGGCVMVSSIGSPAGGAASLQATVPVSAIPGLGVTQTAVAPAAEPVPGNSMTCEVHVRDVQVSP